MSTGQDVTESVCDCLQELVRTSRIYRSSIKTCELQPIFLNKVKYMKKTFLFVFQTPS